jgi:hypothetical protein
MRLYINDQLDSIDYDQYGGFIVIISIEKVVKIYQFILPFTNLRRAEVYSLEPEDKTLGAKKAYSSIRE